MLISILIDLQTIFDIQLDMCDSALSTVEGEQRSASTGDTLARVCY